MDERGDSFGTWLRRRRKALDLTQGALAAKVSCSPAAIKKIEAEERRPSRGLAERLAEHLGIPAPQRAAFLLAARQAQPGPPPVVDGYAPGPIGIAAAVPPLDPGAGQPFVGRTDPFARVLRLLDAVRAGTGRVAVVQGEAGIGKSRLLQEAVTAARQRLVPVLTANCYEIERAIAYQPVIELAVQAIRCLSLQRLRQLPPVLLAEIAALVPALGAGVPDLPALSTDFPEARQARLFQALALLLDAAAGTAGLLIAVDDIQWADDASLRFLHFHARHAAARPVLLMLALRDEELDANVELGAVVASLRVDPKALHLTLSRLSLADVQALLLDAGTPLPASPDLAERLLGESEGNPFFLWSILHALGESASEGGAREPGLPADLRDSVRARLARVPRQQLELLEMASVLGRRFHFETLMALQRQDEGFLQALEALVSRRLLRQEPDGGFHDFSHDKVREVVYQGLGAARRVLLHRQVAQLLERQAGAAHERHGHLAEHYERGEVWPKALQYFGLVAEHSLRLFAIRESLQWFDRAIALLHQHPEAAAPAQQLALYERRGAARAEAGQIEGAVSDLQRVIAAARAAGEQEHARDVLIRLGMAYRRADSYDQAIACLDEALAASRGTGDERHVADSLYHLGTVAWSNGRNDLAIGHHREAVAICERLQLSDVVAVQAFHGLGEACFAQGRPAEAITHFSRSLDLARAVGDRSYEAENLMMIGWACIAPMGLGDHDRALQHLDAALDIATAADLQWHLGPSVIGRAHALAGLGRGDEALVGLEEALPQLETLGLVRYQLMAQDAIGSLLLEAHAPAAAGHHFERALLLAGSAAIRYWVPRVQAGLALSRLGCGVDVDDQALQEALRTARSHQELWQVPRCLQALAESALARGDAGAALGHADALLALGCQGGMREVAAQARRLRARAGGDALGQSGA
ncbi:MAG: transcriptional regulator, family [Ramlibacter sp.]|nr:transcriptional regulator, family [Ramlibacter sp.]